MIYNLFEILTVCQAEFDDYFEPTGSFFFETVFAYDSQDLMEWLFLSRMNGVEAKLWT